MLFFGAATRIRTGDLILTNSKIVIVACCWLLCRIGSDTLRRNHFIHFLSSLAVSFWQLQKAVFSCPCRFCVGFYQLANGLTSSRPQASIRMPPIGHAGPARVIVLQNSPPPRVVVSANFPSPQAIYGILRSAFGRGVAFRYTPPAHLRR